LLACEGDPGGGALVLNRNDPDDFYARPYPSDDRKNADGTIDLSTYPRPSALIKQYVDAIAQDTHGFGESSCIYFRFSAAIDPASLPQTPQDSLGADASVFLTELVSGRRVPVRVHYRAKGGRFSGNDLLAVCPFPGLPLLPRTKYIATVTTDVRTETGVAIAR